MLRLPSDLVYKQSKSLRRRSGAARRYSTHPSSTSLAPPERTGFSPSLSHLQRMSIDLELYDDDHSLFCSKVKLALYAKGVSFKSLPTPSAGTVERIDFLVLTPLGKIPVLKVTEEGKPPFALYESEVIVEWLEERFTGPDHPPLLPLQPLLRAQARIISRFHDLYLEPTLRKLYSQVAPSTRDLVVLTATVKELQGRLDQLDTLLHTTDSLVQTWQPPPTEANSDNAPPAFPLGSLGLADCAYPAAFLYMDIILDAMPLGPDERLRWPERITQWRQALDTNEHVEAATNTLRPAAQAWLDGKLAL